MHLTLTGFYAGRTLCGSEREGEELHASFAPLDKEEFRATVCPNCLREYALSYDDDELDDAPDWVVEIVKKERPSGTEA